MIWGLIHFNSNKTILITKTYVKDNKKMIMIKVQKHLDYLYIGLYVLKLIFHYYYI